MNLPLTPKWLDHFMSLARHCASVSKDPSTKVGSVIVSPERVLISSGYNGFPRGCNDSEALYLNREVKYRRIIHAEMNAILTASKPLLDCTLFVWPLPPCDRCIVHIIQSGIRTIVIPPIAKESSWYNDCASALGMAKEVGLSVIEWDLK